MSNINERKQLASAAAALAMLSSPAHASVEGNLKNAANHTGKALGNVISAAGGLAIDGAKLAGKGLVKAGEYAIDKAPDVYDSTVKLSKKAAKEIERMYKESQKIKPNSSSDDIQKYIDTLIVTRGPEIAKAGKVTKDFVKKYGSVGADKATEAAIAAGAAASDTYATYSPEAKKAFNNAIKTIEKHGIDQYNKSKARLKESANHILKSAIINLI